MSSALYRLLGAGGTVTEAGNGDVTLAGGVLELRPASGAALRVPSARITGVAEPEPFTVLVTLADGTAIELSRLGRMRSQLLEELRDARAEVAAAESGAVGGAARFTATVAGAQVDVQVFEDALIVLGPGYTRRVAFSFVGDVQARDYTVAVDVAGQGTLAFTRLGRRTDEFAGLLGERLGESRSRTSAFLGSLLPGLDPMALRSAAGLLRDGVAVPARALDAIHPDLSATLLRVAALPDRLGPTSAVLSAVAARAELAIGFKQVASVRRPAVGVTPWTDPAAPPHIGEHETPGGRFGAGMGGMLAAGAMAGMGPGGGLGGYGGGGYGLGGYGGPFGGYGDPGYGGLGGYWAFRALGAGLNGNAGLHFPMTARADVRRGLLTPETEDLAALTVSGTDPSVLAFALLGPAGRDGLVAYTVLNQAEPASYVYRAGGVPDPRAAVNQALDDAGFAPAALHAAAAGQLTEAYRRDAAASPLASTLVAEVPHDATWPDQLARLLSSAHR